MIGQVRVLLYGEVEGLGIWKLGGAKFCADRRRTHVVQKFILSDEIFDFYGENPVRSAAALVRARLAGRTARSPLFENVQYLFFVPYNFFG